MGFDTWGALNYLQNKSIEKNTYDQQTKMDALSDYLVDLTDLLNETVVQLRVISKRLEKIEKTLDK